MTNFITALVNLGGLAALFALLVAALQRSHARTHHLPRAPLGADASLDGDARRINRELTAAPDAANDRH